MWGRSYWSAKLQIRGVLSMSIEDAKSSLIKREWTPENLRCWPGYCPAVHELEDGRLLIIGKRTSPQLGAEIASRVGADEHAVVIDRAFFSELFPAGG
jgi:hypothetical protein